MSREWEDKPQPGRKYLQKTSQIRLLPKTYKELLKPNNKKMNNPIKKWAIDLNRHLTKGDRHMANKHKKRCSTSYVFRELQIKTTVRYHYTPIRMAKIQNTNHTKCWWGSKATWTLIYCRWTCKMVQPLWKTVWQFLTKLNVLSKQSSNTHWYLLKVFENLRPQKNLHTDVYSSFIHNCQNSEATKMSFSRWMDKPWNIQITEY